jgi:hypothetical protein
MIKDVIANIARNREVPYTFSSCIAGFWGHFSDLPTSRQSELAR